jgi:hypothetical protein
MFKTTFLAWRIWLITLFPLLIFFVLPAMKEMSLSGGLLFSLQNFSGPGANYLYGVDFDTFQNAANVVHFVDKLGLLGFTNLLGGILFFVPRAIWPDKPLPSGFVVFDELGYTYGNVAIPLYIEFYLAMGLLAVIVGMMLIGWLAALVEGYTLGNGEQKRRRGGDVLVALIGGFAIIIMRGPLNGIMAWVGPPLLIAILVLVFLVRKNPVTGDAPVSEQPTPVQPRDWRERFAAARAQRRHGARVGGTSRRPSSPSRSPSGPRFTARR